ncbi:two component sensor and regulator histidine kinase bacteria [Tritrichomonas foetus]|uniref:Two component sensor and regulator histidine kinase bacteria n=1 Tax=Tritrichomonas foetus TaxID=1144522 RepID=A0A1J4KI33_9EUKA|nr:two component sensor and regulator histidine kinase bacteria [Tritrichomonas foetus]|eukprot:OHT11041.1 two component sensor and regulator histidine kinase bacteria [Tritrichomonas foetus]
MVDITYQSFFFLVFIKKFRKAKDLNPFSLLFLVAFAAKVTTTDAVPGRLASESPDVSKDPNITEADIQITIFYPQPRYSVFRCAYVDSIENIYPFQNKEIHNQRYFIDDNILFKEIVVKYLEENATKNKQKLQITNDLDDAEFLLLSSNKKSKNRESRKSFDGYGEKLVELNRHNFLPGLSTLFQVYTTNNFIDVSGFCNEEVQFSNYYIILSIILIFVLSIFYVSKLKINTDCFSVVNKNMETVAGKPIICETNAGRKMKENFINKVIESKEIDILNTNLTRNEKDMIFHQLLGIPLSSNKIIVFPYEVEFDFGGTTKLNVEVHPQNSKLIIENQKTKFDSLYNEYPILLEFDINDPEKVIDQISEKDSYINSNAINDANIQKIDDSKYHVHIRVTPFVFLSFLPQSQTILILMSNMYHILDLFNKNPFSNNRYMEFMQRTIKNYLLKRCFLFKVKKSNNKISIIAQTHDPHYSDLDETHAEKIVKITGPNFRGYKYFSGEEILPNCNKILVSCLKSNSPLYFVVPIDYNNSSVLFDGCSLPESSLILLHLYQLSSLHRHVSRNNRILSIFQSSQYFSFIEIDGEKSASVRSNMLETLTTQSDLLENIKNIVPKSDAEAFGKEIDELINDCKPIFQRQVSFIGPNNETRSGSVCAIRKVNKQTGRPITSFFFEDTTEIQKKQISLYNAHRSFQIAASALGLHRYSLEKGNIVLYDDSLFEEIGVKPPASRELSEVIAPDDKNKINRPTTNYLSYLNLSNRRQALARQSTLTVRRNMLSGLVKREAEPHETPVAYPKQNSTTLRLVDGNGSLMWYSLISDGKIGFIFSVDDTVKMRRQLQTTDRGLKIASASTLLFTFWGVDINTDSVQQLLKYDTIWDVLGVDQCTPFSKLPQFSLEERDGVEKMITQTREGSILSWNGDVLFDTPRGKKWFRIAVSAAADGNLNCFMMDITEQKSMETLLVQSMKLRDLTLSSAKILLWTFVDGEIVNNAAHTINMNWQFVNTKIEETSREEFTNAIKNAFDTNGNIDCIILFGGKWYSVRGRATDDNQKLVGVLFDITELKQALIDLSREQIRAQEANKLKTTFLANMSHEIRTPMNGIIGMLDILAMHELTVEQRLLTDAIRSSSFDLMKHLTNTLNVSNIEQGTIDIEYTIFDVSQTLQPVAVAAASRALLAKIDLKFEIEPRFPVLIYGESQLFLQIVNNLLSNALKFTKKGSVSVYVSWDVQNERMKLEVSDTGIGMSEEQRNVIFRRFSQADPSVARYYGGTGLGLALVQDLIRILNGTIEFESELGKGTKFIVILPFQPIACPYPISFSLKPQTIVLVTNKSAKNQFVHDFIEFYRFTIEYAETVDEIKDLFNKNDSVVAVFVDIENSGNNAHLVKQYIQKEKPEIRLCSFSTPGNSGDFPRTLTKPLLPKPLRILLNDIRFSYTSSITSPAQDQNTQNKSTNENPPEIHKNEKTNESAPSSDEKNSNVKTTENLEENVTNNENKEKVKEKNAAKVKTPTKILVVEDNKVNQFVMSKMLTKLNFEFRLADNGQKALETLDQEEFNLVFMDCQMPVMDGLEATKRIRASAKKFHTVPIVALTASAIEGDEDTCKAAGMNGYLAKPVRIQQITDAIKKYASQDEEENELC